MASYGPVHHTAAPRLGYTQPPELQVTQAAVEAYLKQKGSVKIEYIGPRGIWA